MAKKPSISGRGRCAALGLCAFLATATARAEPLPSWPPVIGATEVFVVDELSGLGLRGFDAVSYFLGAARAGKPGLEVAWSGLVWRFANEGNRAAFARDPKVYAPRIGGYDPVSAAEGRLVAAEPTLFLVRGERLYLFRGEASRARFESDRSIEAKAEARWPELSRDLVGP